MPRIAQPTILVAACTSLLLAGCPEQALDTGRDGDSVPTGPRETAEMSEKMPPTGSVNYASTSVPGRLVSAMVTDLAKRLELPADAISVLKSVPVIWNDGSIGCPEPGMAYAQVLTSGYWTVLEADGRRYGYHAGERGNFRLCETAMANPDGAPPGGRYAGEAS